MDGADYLLTSGEIAAALAGFSALLVALGDRSGRSQAVRYRAIVASLIERSLIALFFALLPILVSGLGLTETAVWLLCSGGLAGYIFSLAWRSASRQRRDPTFREFVGGRAFLVLFALGLVVLALQLLNAAGWWIQQNVWWYATGVTWLLLSVGYLFFFAVRGWVREV
jgi:hypothetical protein